MIEKWKYTFGVSLPKAIRDKLEESTMIREVPYDAHAGILNGSFVKDAFTSDHYPVEQQEDMIYPVFAPRYIGTGIPETVLNMNATFRKKASDAALCWIKNISEGVRRTWVNTGVGFSVNWTFNGLLITENIGGTDFRFCFPDTTVSFGASGRDIRRIAVFPFADVCENDEDWEDEMIPGYVTQQAQMLLWCWQRYGAKYPAARAVPTEVMVVRCTGNLAANINVRTIRYDERFADRTASRIAGYISKAKAGGKSTTAALRELPKICWQDRKEQMLDDAYRIDSEDFHDLLGQYMAARSRRKTLEQESDALKEQMDAIAYSLASQTEHNANAGTVCDPSGTEYKVTHALSRTSSVRISPDLVRQYYPQHSEFITASIIPRGRISIDVL